MVSPTTLRAGHAKGGEETEALCAALREVIAQQGLDGFGPRPLARVLAMDTATVQRVLAAIRVTDRDRAAQALPGVRGVRNVVEALERHAGRELSELRRAFERHTMVAKPVSSKPRAVVDHRVAATSDSTDPTLGSRRAAFGPAARVSGCSFDEWMYVHVVAPLRGDFSQVVLRTATILGGVRSYDRDVILPLKARLTSGQIDAEIALHGRGAFPAVIEATPSAIQIEPGNAGDDLREQWHTMRLAAGVRDAHVVVTHASDPAPNPCVQEDRYMIHLCTQRAAVRRLTIDSWVHQSMVISGIPEPACVYLQAGVPLTLEAMRARHFPIPISLSVGKDDIPRLSDKSRQLHQNATRQVLAATERPASEFKLVRATCVYPMLGLSYYLPVQYAERAT